MKYEYRITLYYRTNNNPHGTRTMFLTLDNRIKSIADYDELAKRIAKDEKWESCIISSDTFIRTIPLWQRLLKKYASRD